MLRLFERLFKQVLGATLRAIVGSRTPPTPLPSSFQRILVIRQHNQLGDMLCAVPLLRALRRRYPHAQITLMGSPVNAEIMVNLRYLDHVICFDKREFTHAGLQGLRGIARFIRDLRMARFDLVMVPSTVSTSFTSDLLAYLTRAPLRVGIGSFDGKENPSGFFFNLPVHTRWAESPHRHQTLRNMDVGSALGLAEEDLSLEMTLKDSELDEAKAWFHKRIDRSRFSILLHPGAGKVPNRWPTDRFARVAESLAREFNAKIFVTCGPMDSEVVEVLLRSVTVGAEVIQNEAIRRVASYIGQMDLVISNDTGIMHVAAAVGTPVLSLFGPTDPAQWAPIGERNRYIGGREGEIETITVEEVLARARAMLRERPPREPGGTA